MEAAITQIRQSLKGAFTSGGFIFTEEQTSYDGKIDEYWFYLCRENYYGCVHLEMMYEYEDGTPRISATFFDSSQPPFDAEEDYTTDELEAFLPIIIERVKAKNN